MQVLGLISGLMAVWADDVRGVPWWQLLMATHPQKRSPRQHAQANLFHPPGDPLPQHTHTHAVIGYRLPDPSARVLHPPMCPARAFLPCIA